MSVETKYALMRLIGGNSPDRSMINLGIKLAGGLGKKFWHYYHADDTRPAWTEENFQALLDWGDTKLADFPDTEEGNSALLDVIGHARCLLPNGDKVMAIQIYSTPVTDVGIAQALAYVRDGGANGLFTSCKHEIDGNSLVVLKNKGEAQRDIRLLMRGE